jgi:putative transposase
VLIHKGFRYRIYPSAEQSVRLLAWEHALRFLWNIALEQRRLCLKKPRDERVYLSAFDQSNDLTELRASLPWLADVPRNVCGQLLADLASAWQRCFAGTCEAPRFKAKGRTVLGLCEPHPGIWRLDGSTIRFPKLGNLRAVVHRPLEGKPKRCTIKRDGDQWFASIVCEIDLPDPVPRHEPVVALDRGVVNLIADSDGVAVENPRFYTQSMKRLGRAQRGLARKKKGSKNSAKARARVAAIHRRVRRQREHVVQNLSAAYAKNHGTVVVENLSIRSMTKSAAGTKEAPGSRVRQKSGLNRSILDAGWGRLTECLRYKLAWGGGQYAEEVAAFSSQTCNACGHVSAESRRSQAVFACVSCGEAEHADVNAAKVLKKRFLESRANRSALPVEGTAPKAARRSRKLDYR